MVGAAILAGGVTDDKLFAIAGTREKALIRLQGRPMLDYVLDAVTACSALEAIVIVSPAGSEVAKHRWRGIPHAASAGPDPIDSIVAGAEALTAADKVLICACDLPLLAAHAVGEFVARGLEADVDCCYPIVAESLVEAQFPGCPRTYINLRNGRFTSGNIALVARSFVLEHRERIHAAFSVRKSPVRTAAVLGPLTALRLALGIASIEGLAARGAKALDCTVAVLQCEHAGIAFDVDKPSDLELAEQVLAERARPKASR